MIATRRRTAMGDDIFSTTRGVVWRGASCRSSQGSVGNRCGRLHRSALLSPSPGTRSRFCGVWAPQALWLAPELLSRWTSRAPSRPAIYVALLVAGFGLSAAWPLAWESPNSVSPYGGPEFRHDTGGQIFFAGLSCLGLLAVAMVAVIAIANHILDPRDTCKPASSPSRSNRRRPGHAINSMNRRRRPEVENHALPGDSSSIRLCRDLVRDRTEVQGTLHWPTCPLSSSGKN